MVSDVLEAKDRIHYIEDIDPSDGTLRSTTS